MLVGHSFAGTVISEAGIDPKVAALVYVAARAPDAGEDYTALATKFPRPPASDGLVASGGFAQLSEEAFLKYFAGDVDPVKARILYAVQGRVSTSLFSGRTTVAAWRSKPAWYQISANDKTISPELQRFMADRMKAKTIEPGVESRFAHLASGGDRRADSQKPPPHGAETQRRPLHFSKKYRYAHDDFVALPRGRPRPACLAPFGGRHAERRGVAAAAAPRHHRAL